MIRKNLKSLIRRYPVAVILNLAGLVCAYAAFSLIFLQADYELSFDRCYPTADRIFRVDKKGDESLFRNVLPRGFADDIIASSAHIEAGCSIIPFFGETYFTTTDGQDRTAGYKRTLVCATERFIDVFDIRMVEGDRHALERPGTVIIPQSLAGMLFPGEPAVGRLLHTDARSMLRNDTDGTVTVSGVYEDFPSNTQLGNDLYMAAGDLQQGSYGGANFICYLLLDDAAHAGTVADDFNSHFDFAPHGDWLTPIELVPFTDIYFRNEGDIYKSGSRSQLLLLITIAILILAIGLINFTNFYVALTPLRIRNIHLQQILGASTARLRAAVIAEAVLWCLCAFAIAVLLLGPVSEALFAQGVLMQAFSWRTHGSLVLFVGMVALVSGIVAGIGPSLHSTSGQPAMIFRGNYGLSASGKTLRAALVGVQSVVSIALLVFVLSVQRQSRYMQDYPCGYDRDDLAVVDIGGRNSMEKADWLRETLRQIPEVEDVAFALELIGSKDVYSTATVDFGEGGVMMSMMYCTYNLPEVLGIEVTEGRGFHEGSRGEVLLTCDTYAHGARLDMTPEEFGGNVPVVGFLKGLNITSMRKTDAAVGFEVVDPQRDIPLNHAYIRLSSGTDRLAAISKIASVLGEMDAAYPFEVRSYDAIGKNLYSGEERLRHSVWLFSLLAVLLSLIGIWGQVLMDVQYKRTEISIKRVFGADVQAITAEGLLLYLRTVAVCYLIAAPAGWLIVSRYLRQFSHRIGFPPGVFLTTLAVVVLLCAAVVLSHYAKAARTNPATVLKKE